MNESGSIWGAAIGMAACLSLIAIGAAIIMKRPETNSLFVEDRFGFALAKIVTGTILIILGGVYFPTALAVLVRQCGV
jgi:hypothetical protein